MRPKSPVRLLQRRLQVQATFLRYGLDILIAQDQLEQVRHFLTRRLGYPGGDDLAALSLPARVRLMLEELGPAYVKLGQVVSSQAQSLPPDWLAELEKLQDTVPPAAPEHIRTVIIEEFGRPPEEIFAEFEPDALAAASIGQVHRAVTHAGELVVVKIQRPNIRPQIADDLILMTEFAGLLAARSSLARNFDVVGIVQKFAASLEEELNYFIEAHYAERLQVTLQPVAGVRTPKIYWDLTTERVLTMERIEGVKINQVPALLAAGFDPPALGLRFTQAMVQQILLDGFFHADPHPGNIFVDLAGGDIVFLDAGMTDLLDEHQRLALGRLMIAMYQRDAFELTRLALQLGQAYKLVDEPALRRAISRLLNRYLASPRARTPFSQIIRDIMTTLFEHGLRLSSELTLAIKALVQLDQITKTLNPEASVNQNVEIIFKNLVAYNPQQILRRATRGLQSFFRLVPEISEAAGVLLQQMKQGRITIQFHEGDVQKHVKALDEGANRVTAGLVLGGVTIASAMVVQATTTQPNKLVSRLGWLGFFLTLCVNFFFLSKITRRLLKHRQPRTF